MRPWHAVSTAVCLVTVVGGCTDHADSRTTARIDHVAGRSICITPKDPDQAELVGCFRLPADAHVRVGDCIDVWVPAEADSGRADRPLSHLRVLDRPCKLRG